MSRKQELLKLAKLFYSQARRTGNLVNKTLRKLGDYYQHEAEELKERPCTYTERSTGKSHHREKAA